MNPIEQLKHRVEEEFGDVSAVIDAPIEGGDWYLDIKRNNKIVVIAAWQPNKGFAISAEGFDEIILFFNEVDSAFRRVRQLLDNETA